MSAPTFLMCAPSEFAVSYEINPWMQGNVGRADRSLAQKQWNHLVAILRSQGVEVRTIEPASDLPDMPFTANAGLVCRNLFVASRFRFAERRPESELFSAWFAGWELVTLPNEIFFEGEGDALTQAEKKILWGGHGFRSSSEAYDALQPHLDLEIVKLRLVDDRFYHLDTCFAPLPSGELVYYPGAFDAPSLAEIRRRVPASDRFEVSVEDALKFCCNAVITDQLFVSSFVGTELRHWLAERNLNAISCPLDQFMLAGGGAKCLVLNLQNRTAF